MITHEKYLSLSTKSHEIGKNMSRNERQDLYFHPDIMMNQKNDDGDVDMYHNEDGDVDTYHNEEKGTAAVTTTTTTSTTCPLQPQDVWNHFFELCSTISSAKTSAEIQSSILSLREDIFTEENRRKGLHWVKCMRDVVNRVYRLRLERPSLWTNIVANEYADLLKSLRGSIPGYENHMKAIAHAHRMTQTYGFEMEDICAQVVDLVNYYSSQRTRLHMTETWKGLKKREKIRRSMLPWLKLLPLDSSLRVNFMNDCMDYIR